LNVVIRFARERDRDDVMEFVRNTWPWGDYIPEVWDTWLADNRGKMFVLELEGKVVGMNHIRILEEGVGWLEGVRIRPEYRGRGFATLLGEEAMNYARKMGIKKFRLLSHISNKPAHKQVRKMNFKKVGIFNGFELEGQIKETSQIILDQKYYSLAERSLLESKEFKLAKGFFFDSWTMRSFLECGVVNVFRRFNLHYNTRNKHSAFLLYGRSEGAEKFHQLNFAWGDSILIKEMLQAISSYAGTTETLLPKSIALTRSMKGAGFKKKSEMILYEKIES
jgi:ribosomal protein S18 acetylase RimI-like enzyme